ncbi:glycosyltransferase [Agromyces archimandritae]|uniref:Glycosyltransferase n=1 Tax=Agromyces archimandritae TaxID=2781962 RepID=A0A975FN64_9MICO|nr:glycosyltransferase [Agromyces archimandritae]QTX05245.1 glycosyltransferase [Agromyces archimandritae]
MPRVTAILVVHHGGNRLARTLDAIEAGRRRPDDLVAVLVEPDEAETEAVRASAAGTIVASREPIAFGAAVATGIRGLDRPFEAGELLWLLSHDAAPEPGALEALLAELETSPSVVLAGPKLVDWEHGERIASLGRTVTRFGRTVELVDGELDQSQHDHRTDVLAVAPAGLLVDAALWQELGGLDPALPVVDDALDLSVRARLAGYRVAVAPAARVAFAGDGVADPGTGGKARDVRRRDRQRRRAALHRRLAWAPAWAVAVHWISLLPIAVGRSVWRLLAKTPGSIPGEFAAAVSVMASPVAVSQSRRRIRRTKRAGWKALAPLRADGREMAVRRQAEREATREKARGSRPDIDFLHSGGGWTLLVTGVIAVALFLWMFGKSGIVGGGLMPLSSSLAELWSNAAYGTRAVGTGSVGAADPFAGLLAVFGSITFWAPSFSLLLVWMLAVPVAALGAWLAAARLTERGGIRAAAGIVWAIAPPFLTALGEGRPGAVLAHVLLPWLVFAAAGAARSWTATATASLLFAGVAASAPVLLPAMLVAWVAALCLSGRGAVRLAWLPLPALVLFAPLAVEQFRRGTLLALFADPGPAVPHGESTIWQLAAGFPAGGWGGWTATLELSPFSAIPPSVLVAILLAPFALLAFSAVTAPRMRAGVFALAVALLGFATAVAATRLQVATTGSEAVAVWSGSGLSLGWLGLVIAMVVSLRRLRRTRVLAATVAAGLVVIASLPLAVGLAVDRGQLRPAAVRTLPAFVTAEADSDPGVVTLRMTPQADGGIRAQLERGTGSTLDDQSTLVQTAPAPSDRDAGLAVIAGNLASRSGFDAERAAEDFGVRFILLTIPRADEGITREVVQTAERARAALDANPALVPVGDTDFGQLWRFADAPGGGSADPAAPAGTVALITIAQLLVVGIALLLSIPTGTPADPVERKPRRRRGGGAAPSGPPDTSAEADPGASADAEPSADPDAADGSAGSHASADAEPDASAGSGPDASADDGPPSSAPADEPRGGSRG